MAETRKKFDQAPSCLRDPCHSSVAAPNELGFRRSAQHPVQVRVGSWAEVDEWIRSPMRNGGGSPSW
jgi:hypothetical protein